MTFIKNLDLFTMPLEQFEVVPVTIFGTFLKDINFSNVALMVLILFVLTLACYNALVNDVTNNSELKNKGFFIVPNRWQVFFEKLHTVLLSLVVENIKDKKAQEYFPLIFFTFLFIFSLNLIGLIPFTYTLTSQLAMMITMSTAMFIGINIIGVRKHKLQYFSLFLPSGTPIILGLLLVPIELLSFLFKPVSLAVRIFANMMAGHTLLKVIAGFAITLMAHSGVALVGSYAIILLLVPVLFLEFAVAIIQAFVFSILVCSYIDTAMNLH